MKGLVIKSTGSWYRVEAASQVFDCRLRGKFRLKDTLITNPIAVGDQVEIEEESSGRHVITKIHDRSNYVIRISPKKKNHYHLIAANVDLAVLISSLKSPRTSIGFIDRFFVTLETFRIPGALIINKSDLYNEEELNLLEHTKALYDQLGYPTVITSITEHGSQDVDYLFQGKTTLLTGHSGTGKSTLINAIIPGIEQEVSEISNFANKGIHTTTFAEMFSINKDSKIIDTPGIKELGLAEIEKNELSHYFPEMRTYLGKCKYYNCLHENEPGCLVIQALHEGEISLSRYQSYLSMLENYDNRR